MTAEGPGGGELAQLVTHHILLDIHRHMAAAVMDGDGVTDESGEDGGAAAPGLQHALLALGVHFFNPLDELRGNIRAFFHRSAHINLPPLLLIATLDNELVGRVLLLAGLVTQSGLAPRSNRAGTTHGGLALTTAVGVVAGVHDGTADGGTPTHVALPAGLTDLNVLVLQVAHLADAGLAVGADDTHFAGRLPAACF